MTIKQAKENMNCYIELVIDKNYCDCNELNIICSGKHCDGSKNVAEAGKILLNLIQKQDKIIDLMSERLTTPIHSKEWVKRYYEEEVGD